MTVLAGFVSRQFTRTVSSPRRLRVIMALLVIVIAAGIVLMLQRYPAARGIQYQTEQTIIPVPSALCPGEQFSYHQAIRVETTSMVTISREWCNRNFTCDLGLHQSWSNVILTPLDFTGLVTRTVPASTLWKPGGLYEFRSGVRNGELSVQIIEFSIREDCP